jgi:UDP-glucose 4-epimerase
MRPRALVLHAFTNAKMSDLFVQKAPAATIGTLAEAVLEVLDKKGHPISVIGTRHGGKDLRNAAEPGRDGCCRGPGRVLPRSADNRDLNYSAYVEGDRQIAEI